MRVLLVEDNPATADYIELLLKKARVTSAVCRNGRDAVDMARHFTFDLILLDLGLPDMSGLAVLREIRRARVETPILILTDTHDPDTKVLGFLGGADDYLTKPFDMDELLARINAIVRRTKGHSQSLIAVGDLELDLDSKQVAVKGEPVHLTGKEYQLLELLMLRKGTTQTKEAILDSLYGGTDEPEMKIIDVFVCKLRKRLADASGGDGYIETVWGRGYMIRDGELGVLDDADAQVA